MNPAGLFHSDNLMNTIFRISVHKVKNVVTILLIVTHILLTGVSCDRTQSETSEKISENSIGVLIVSHGSHSPR